MFFKFSFSPFCSDFHSLSKEDAMKNNELVSSFPRILISGSCPEAVASDTDIRPSGDWWYVMNTRRKWTGDNTDH